MYEHDNENSTYYSHKVGTIYIIPHWSLTKKACKITVETTKHNTQTIGFTISFFSISSTKLSCFFLWILPKMVRWSSVLPSFTLDSKLWEFKTRRSLQLGSNGTWSGTNGSPYVWKKHILDFRFPRYFPEWMMLLERWISRNYCNISISNHSSFVVWLNLA